MAGGSRRVPCGVQYLVEPRAVAGRNSAGLGGSTGRGRSESRGGDARYLIRRAGILLDLKSAMGSSFINEFLPSINQEYSDGDKQYAIGWEAQMFGMFYNPDILKKANVDLPETWDDLITASAQIRSKTGLTPVALNGNPSNNVADFYLPLVTQASNNPDLVYQLDNQTSGASWNSKYPIEAFQMLQKLQRTGCSRPGQVPSPTPRPLPCSIRGKSAMLSFGSFIVPGLLTSASPAFNALSGRADAAWTPEPATGEPTGRRWLVGERAQPQRRRRPGVAEIYL